jgi:hypothetical protein
MKYKVKTFIGCEQCGADFGGPNAGEYEDWDNRLSGVTLPEYLAEEALAMMWIRVVWGSADVLLCSVKCVAAWLKEASRN